MGGRRYTSSIYCRYVPGGEAAGTKLYCLVTEARVRNQLAQSRYSTVQWSGVKPATSRSLVHLYTTNEIRDCETDSRVRRLRGVRR